MTRARLEYLIPDLYLKTCPDEREELIMEYVDRMWRVLEDLRKTNKELGVKLTELENED